MTRPTWGNVKLRGEVGERNINFALYPISLAKFEQKMASLAQGCVFFFFLMGGKKLETKRRV